MPTRSIQKKKSAKDFFNNSGRKKFAIFTVVVLAAIGAYLLFFAKAATNNCQPENGVQICDVDQTAASNDTVLSTNGEAESLAQQGWGTYFGAAFRAPMTAYDGAVPVTRVNNGSATWHEFVTDAQKGQKEAKAGGAQNLSNEGVYFFAWTDGHHPGTVPVYRMTRMGTETQSMYSTDKGWIDQQVNGPWGWKLDDTMPSVAFYAFPPNYMVAGQANPYDCSILENFVTERCAVPAKNLQTNIDAGNVAATCPTTWADWNKTVNASSLDQACQDKWNKYATNCSNTDVFMSDRCKAEREALAAANKAAQDARDAAAAAARKKSGGTKKGGSSGGGSTTTTTGGGTTTTTTTTGPCPAGQVKRGGECRVNPSTTLPSAPGPCKDGEILRGGDCRANPTPNKDVCAGLKGPSYSKCEKAGWACTIKWNRLSTMMMHEPKSRTVRYSAVMSYASAYTKCAAESKKGHEWGDNSYRFTVS